MGWKFCFPSHEYKKNERGKNKMNEEKTTKLKSRRLNSKKSQREIDLEKKILEMQEQLEAIKEPKIEGTSISEEERIDPTEYIKVMSLTNHLLNLTTQPGGGGKVYSFSNGFGEVKRIPYSYLADIIENHQSFVEAGNFYIMDKRVISQHGLDDVYEKILDKDKIEQIFNGNKNDALNLFKMANPKQQEMIINMLIEKLRDDPEFDLNVIETISKYSKVNLQEKAIFAREFMEDEEKNEQEEK
jgi:hypothetical protein